MLSLDIHFSASTFYVINFCTGMPTRFRFSNGVV